MVMRFSSLFAIIFVSLLFSHDALADEIVLVNGDRISGDILYISPIEIEIKTDYAGDICLPLSMAASISTDRPGRVLLKNGDILIGSIRSRIDDHILIQSPFTEEVLIPLDEFARFEQIDPNTDIQPSSEVSALAEETPAEKPEDESPDLWTGSVVFGTQLHEGNTDDLSLHFEANAVRKLPREELSLKVFSNYSETEGDTDQNVVFGESKLKLFPNTRWYLFGVSNLEYDEMENLGLRAQLFGGPGYYFIKKENLNFLGEMGVGLVAEFFDEDGEEDTTEPAFWLNAEWKQKLSERIEFLQTLTLFPTIGDFDDYRIRSTSAISTLIKNSWWVKFSAIDEYDSNPETEDVERNDLRVFSSIEYKF
ncbi:MAG: DUF481 domain-containing protein [Candidatus Abyssobacteria bacterium SURF_5]|uniref:DUF481 domain-containing protein n=1 Tax=Abyssobacteria bacterium (strain SURF_5) TaxID=2093360 RepID=A0A3A4NQR3_ABYX5|nr:MAG: DUF481 domain-containing protein [Candidatus Abyssubacteria bacterium SURF_5]